MNHNLADRMNVSQENREKIVVLHRQLEDVLNNPPEDAPERVTEIEYELQSLWGFSQDPKYHRYNYRIKGCRCGTLDNDDMVGFTANRWVTQGCPWHG